MLVGFQAKLFIATNSRRFELNISLFCCKSASIMAPINYLVLVFFFFFFR